MAGYRGLAYLFLTGPVIAAVAIACYDSPPSPSGGDPLFDAALPNPISEDAGDASDAPACPDPDAGDATWTALYADFFGPTGIGQCGDMTRADGTEQTSCHHDATGNGAVASGFICGDTQQSCWSGITNPAASFIGQQVVIAGNPCASYLTQVLRHDGGGLMPYYPQSVVFSDQDMARVATWIAQGAQNN